jgi:vanillate O-demethylase ferredoxin subunit
MTLKTIPVRVVDKRRAALDICLFELERSDGQALPPFSAGSHIDVHLPGGLVRQYSLCNDPAQHQRYQICILLDPHTRGGSRAMHDKVAVGDTLLIGEPRNLFHLVPGEHAVLLLAAGIGVTPLLSMAWKLLSQGRRFHLHYFTRSAERTAFHAQILQSPLRAMVSFWFDDAPGVARPSIGDILDHTEPDAHVYACGPLGFLKYVQDTCAQMQWAHLHYEAFTAAPVAAGEAFTVKLQSSGRLIAIPAGQTVVEALAQAGVEIPVSCEQGICGTCLTRVCEGVPDHRDQYLTDQERERGDQFTPCCSRARSPVLVLDL